MKEVIYNTLDDAKQVCKAYVDAVTALQEHLGIRETSDDSCVQTYLHVKYRTKDGKVAEYAHW